MKRLAIATGLVALLLAFFAPAALAADPLTDTGPLLVAVNRSVDIPAGDRLDTLVVAGGDARVSGNVGTIVVARGAATLTGATARSLVVIDGTADLGAGTTVTGEISTLNGTVTQEAGSTVTGGVRRLDGSAAGLWVVLIPALILLFLGFGLVAVVAALIAAAFGARQLRAVEGLISSRPGEALVAGIAGSIVLPLLAIVLVVTVVGAPIGILALVVGLPVVAFLSWLVAAVWVGDWVVGRRRGAPETDRPYVAAVVGVVVLALACLLPFVSTVATLFGFGGLILAAWQTLRRDGSPLTSAAGTAGTAGSAPSAA